MTHVYQENEGDKVEITKGKKTFEPRGFIILIVMTVLAGIYTC